MSLLSLTVYMTRCLYHCRWRQGFKGFWWWAGTGFICASSHSSATSKKCLVWHCPSLLWPFKHIKSHSYTQSGHLFQTHLQTVPLLRRSKGPGCVKDLLPGEGESGDPVGTVVPLIPFPFRKSALVQCLPAVSTQGTDQCPHYNNPCLEGMVKATRFIFIHESGTETSHRGCSFWQWGRHGLSNQCAFAGAGDRSSVIKPW